MAYTKTIWNNDTTPAISADNLNKIEDGIKSVDTAIEGHLVNVAPSVDDDYKVNFLKGKNLIPINPNDMIFNRYIDNSGNFVSTSSGNYYGSDIYINFSNYAGKTITLSEGLELAYYDTSKTFISLINRTADRTQLVPNNCGYIRIDCWKDNVNTIQIELGSTATTYEPYITPTINVDGDEIYNQQYCNVLINDDLTITSQSSTYSSKKVLFDKIVNVGNFSLNDNSIVIGKNINKVLVSLNMNIYNAVDNHFYNPTIKLYRNGSKIDQINCPRYLRNTQGSYSVSPSILEVQENDIIFCDIQIGTASETFKVSKNGTNIFVQKLN